MHNDLDELAALCKTWRLVLCFADDGSARLAFRYRLPVQIRSAIRSRRRGLARLMASGDIRLCPSPDMHRQFYRYIGNSRYQCEMCLQLDQAQLGLWQKVG